MNEQELLRQWRLEKPMYEAWGDLVVSTICEKLERSGKNLSSFLKLPCKHRTKDEASLIDKAFYRAGKNYDEPYINIEDKVGCRFVVLLVEQIEDITSIIDDSGDWDNVKCRHFSQERESAPLLFTYQSVHYVVRAKNNIEHKGCVILKGTPCEIQIRTLLQHAYAELTHDAVYKAKKLVEPSVHRTIAKSMALIETTDDFFSTVNNRLTSDVAEEIKFQDQLNSLYNEYVGLDCTPAQKSSLVILDAFKGIIDGDILSTLKKFLARENYISELILQGRNDNPFYTQSIALLVYFLIKKKKRVLMREWPLDRKIIDILASEIGVSLDIDC